MRRFLAGLLIIVSALALVLASTSLWTRRNVINTQVFVSNVNTMVDLPQVETRVNNQVTTTVMANPQVKDAIDQAVAVLPPRLQQFRPTVENGIRSLISAGVARLLTNDPFRPLTDAALTSAHDQLVNGQPVKFTLGQAKNLVPASARDGIAGQVLDLLPNDVGVTLLTPADAPQVYNAIDLLKSVWWWLGLLALATLAGALGVSRHRRRTLRAWSITTTVLILLVLITLRVARGRLVVQVKAENRDAVGAVYDVLAGSLRSWTLWLLAIVLVVLVMTLVWGRLGIVAGGGRGAPAARERLQQRREGHAAAVSTAEAGAGQLRRRGGAHAAAGSTAEPGTVAPAEKESWPRRVAIWTGAFTDGLQLPERTARLGAFVRDHRDPARWAGIVVGALVLLFWPHPTLSVLIWIAALVALYLGALTWLERRAPQLPVEEAAEPAAAATVERFPAVPAPRSPDGNGAPGAGAVDAEAVDAPAAPLVPAALTTEAISVLNDRLDLLVRLGAARDAGVLSDEEFGREKHRLMGV